MLELHDFEVFVAAARCGSFTEAAASMRLSVSAVSRTIARLEDDLGARLFNRTTRRLNLTAEGQLMLVEATAGIERLRNAKALLHEQQHRASGTLKVLLPNAFCKHYMMPDLPEFLERHPELELDMYVEDYGTDLLAGGFDVAVQYGPVPANGYISRALGNMEVLLVASPAYIEKHGKPSEVEDLERHARINLRGTTGGAPYPWDLQHIEGGPIIRHRPAGRCFVNSQLDAIIHAALHGVGIAPSDVRTIERYLHSGELKVVLPEYRMVGGGEVILLYAHREYLPLKSRVFIDFLADISQRRMKVAIFDSLAFAA
jgi:LysR family transcriptional regulator, transcriptional activator for dmlA